MNKNIPTWQDRTRHDPNRVYAWCADEAKTAEIAELRAYIAELEARTPAAPVVAEGLDDLIERAALAHVAPLFRKIGPHDADYRKTEQFSRLKAFTLDLMKFCNYCGGKDGQHDHKCICGKVAAHPVAGSPAEASRVINLNEVSLKIIHDTYEAAFSPLDPNLMANDIEFHICELIKAAAAEPMPASEARDCNWYAELDRMLARWSIAAEDGHFSYEGIRDQIVAYCAAPVPASEAAKQADQAHVMPPFAAPASQRDANLRDVIEFAIELGERDSPQIAFNFLSAWQWETDDFLRSQWPEFARLELASRFRAEGGNTNDSNTNLAAPAAPTDAKADQVRHALQIAMDICDSVPTRLHDDENETFARIGRLVNAQPDGSHGYAVIRDALATYSRMADIPHGAALGANGVTYHGIEEIYHRMEAGEALHMWLDDAQVPRTDADEKVYSLVGRVQQYAAAQSVRDALEQVAQACENERVEDTGTDGDVGYNMAIRHAAAAIRALIQSPQPGKEA